MATQFGAGSQLAARCPSVPAPDGWRPWTDADGPIPDALTKRAGALAADVSVQLGSTESYPLPGVTALIRTEPRVWSRDEKGVLVEGCFRAAAVYLPINATVAAGVTPPSEARMGKIIGVLTVGSLVVGTAASLARWSK